MATDDYQGPDTPQGANLLSAKFNLTLGSMKDSADRLTGAINRSRNLRKPTQYRLDGQIVVGANPIDGFVNLGSPSQGQIWTVRSVFITGGAPVTANHPMMRLPATAAYFSLHSTATPDVTQVTATGVTTLTPYNTIWAHAANISFTGGVWDDPSADACNVTPSQNLVAAAWNGANMTYAVSVVVEVFDESQSRQDVVV